MKPSNSWISQFEVLEMLKAKEKREKTVTIFFKPNFREGHEQRGQDDFNHQQCKRCNELRED